MRQRWLVLTPSEERWHQTDAEVAAALAQGAKNIVFLVPSVRMHRGTGGMADRDREVRALDGLQRGRVECIKGALHRPREHARPAGHAVRHERPSVQSTALVTDGRSLSTR